MVVTWRSKGDMGRSVAFGATIPGAGYSVGRALAGEVVTTFAMVTLLCVFVAFRPLLGTFLAMLACSRLAKRIEVAKLYHFETANDRLARRAS
jgi:aquaporin Z